MADLSTGVQWGTLHGHEGLINSAAFGLDGTLVTTAQDGYVGFWKISQP